MHQTTHTLIISDLHLGSAGSSATKVLALLERTKFKRLIILGDLFDHAHIKKLKTNDWQLLSRFASIAASGIEVIWVKGNHDRVFPHQISELKNIQITEEVVWHDGGKKYIATHGDQFDENLKNKPPHNILADAFSKTLSALGLKNKLVMSTLGTLYGYLINLSDQVAVGALQYGIEHNADYILCGHTHVPVIKTHVHEQKKVEYFNSGSWTQLRHTYITVDTNGPKLHYFRSKQ